MKKMKLFKWPHKQLCPKFVGCDFCVLQWVEDEDGRLWRCLEFISFEVYFVLNKKIIKSINSSNVT